MKKKMKIIVWIPKLIHQISYFSKFTQKGHKKDKGKFGDNRIKNIIQ